MNEILLELAGTVPSSSDLLQRELRLTYGRPADNPFGPVTHLPTRVVGMPSSQPGERLGFADSRSGAAAGRAGRC